MRISDWSSDVCSSDLILLGELNPGLRHLRSIYRAARRIRHHARSADVSAADIIQEGTVAQGWAAVLFGRHAMMDLYFVTSPNVTKVVIALEEMGLEYRFRPTDLSKGEHLDPATVAGARSEERRVGKEVLS